MKIRKKFLPYALPLLDKSEINEVIDTLKSNWLTMGPKTKLFEEKFAQYIGCKFAISVNSCTSALHLSLLAHGIGAGDEVIVPSFTFAATANTVVHVGAKPVFADIQRDTFNIDPTDIARKITNKTKAIVVVHYGGQAVDLDEINKIARKNKLIIIEDAAHATGSEYNGRKIGSFVNTACFSFYATKNMTTGEGGMITTNNKKIADFLIKNRLHGISKDAWKRYAKGGNWKYEVENAGYKYNSTDIQAALGLHQLKKLNQFIKIRQKYALLYDKAFKELDGITLHKRKDNRKHAVHLYPILLEKTNRDKFIEKMQDLNIGTSVHFIPLHLQPFYRQKYDYQEGDLPVTEEVFAKIVSLPLYPGMTEKDINYVIDSVKKIVTS